MRDLLAGAGIALVVEGLLWALAPGLAIRMLEVASVTPEGLLRGVAWFAVAIGFVLVWSVRG
ncbi:MAG: DUF2065 domain-containing protein [Hyphomicrobium sp.]